MTHLQTKPSRSRISSTARVHENLTALAPPKRQFFPGWIVLGVAALGMFASAPGQSFSIATFKEPMEQVLAVSDTSFSAAYLIATLISGACLPFVGRMTDRYGARLLLPILAAALGISCLFMSRVQGFFGLFIGFCLIRPLGQGALTLVSTWLVGHWFEKRRGIAMGLLGLGGTLSVMLIPQINYFIMTRFDWRAGWVAQAAIVCGILILPAMFFVRNRPEDIGWLPDGGRPDPKNSRVTPTTGDSDATILHVKHDPNFTANDAYRDPAFWKLLVPLCTASLVGTGLIFHQVSIFFEQGLSMATAVTTLSLQAVVASVSSLFFGYLTDRFPERRLLTLAMLCLMAAQLLLTAMNHVTWAVMYGMLLGIQGGIIRTAGNAVWVNYYGRLHQGAIRGIVLTVQIIASALGPLPFALAKDHLGSYAPANLAMLILPLISAIIVWTAYPPDGKRAVS